MKAWKLLSLAAVSAAIVAAGPSDSRACAVLTPDETAPVTGHQMILSISKDRTTLWDQFNYDTNNPDLKFAWILPTKGKVTVGLSSDALFDTLGQVTAPEIFAPNLCPNSCLGGGGGGDGKGSVDVISRDILGPYEVVQLSSSDPQALKDWLAMNGYPIPASVGPILDAYVNEGFDFLALKLAAGATPSSRPVRVTMEGAAPTVPIRLLAAGTGDVTQVTLWVLGEGRWDPSNAPVVTLKSSDLTWDFSTSKSDYSEVRAAKLAEQKGLAWLLEQATPRDPGDIEFPLQQLVMSNPDKSGYGDMNTTPDQELAADLDALVGDFKAGVWVTRLSADLSREALAKDLALGAGTQEVVSGSYTPGKTLHAPVCGPDPCAGEGGGGSGSSGGNGSSGGCSCRMAGDGASDASSILGALGLAAMAALRGRRRRR